MLCKRVCCYRSSSHLQQLARLQLDHLRVDAFGDCGDDCGAGGHIDSCGQGLSREEYFDFVGVE